MIDQELAFGWPDATFYADELTYSGVASSPAMIAEKICDRLNYLVPEYDRKHRSYSPELAIESGATTCKTRAYMAHLIAMQIPGIRSAVNLEAVEGHADVYITDGQTCAVVDSTIGSRWKNSFSRVYKPELSDEYIKDFNSYYPLIEYFRITDRNNGFVWMTEADREGVKESGEAHDAFSLPLCADMPDMWKILMLGETGRLAMRELLIAKQEIADVVGPGLEDLLADNYYFPNALVTHPRFW